MPDVFVSNSTPPKELVNSPRLPDVEPPTNGGKVRIFSAFNYCPDNIDFESKEKEEKIVLLLRQHPIVNIRWILVSIILFLCPAILNKVGVLSFLPSGYPIVVTLSWYLVTFVYAIEGFFSWYFNVFFITTRRVIDVDFYNLIDKRVSDAEIEKIQDVSYSTNGPLQTMFNFGDVLIQTAAEIQELDFSKVPNPERVAKILDDLREAVH